MACVRSVPASQHGTHRRLGTREQIWADEPVSEQHRHSEYFWKPNKTNPAVFFIFLINDIFVLINSIIVMGLETCMTIFEPPQTVLRF